MTILRAQSRLRARPRGNPNGTSRPRANIRGFWADMETGNDGKREKRLDVNHLVDLLRTRRTRRFGLGMEMKTGPMAYRSRHAGVPLTEEENALLVFAASGITGRSLADL